MTDEKQDDFEFDRRFLIVQMARRAHLIKEKLNKDFENNEEFTDEDWDRLTVYFALATEYHYELAKKVFVYQIIDNRFIETNNYNEELIVNQLSRKETFEVLRHYDIIPKDVMNYVENTNYIRNMLIHDPYDWDELDSLDRIQELITESLKAGEYLHGLYSNKSKQNLDQIKTELEEIISREESKTEVAYREAIPDEESS